MSSKSTTSESAEYLTGSLDKVSLPNLLISLQNSKKTGSLEIDSKYELTIFCDQGFPYFAAGASGETLLGKILLNKNKITKYQYDKAAEEIKKNKDKRIGEILVNLGMITPHELNDYLELQLKEKILESFLYLEGNYEFDETNNIDNSIFYSKINTSELIHDGFQRFVKSTDVDFDIIDVEFIEDLNDKTTNIGLGPKELRLVQLISQNKSLKDIEKSGKFKKDEILRVVFILGLYDLATLRNLSINNYLLEEFNKFRLMNPLPEQTDTNYTVLQSELTDPTAEVLLLDEELEATAEREKLELNSEKDADEEKAGEESIEVDDLAAESEDEGIGAENENQGVDNNETAAVKIDEADEDEEQEDISILEAAENFNFQDEYEGDQEAIDIKKSKKKKTQTKQREKAEEIEVQTDDKTSVESSDDTFEEQIEAESENGTPPEVEDVEIQAEQANGSEEAGSPDQEAQTETTEAEKEEVISQDDQVLKELNDFYEFINKEDDYYELLRVEKSATSEDIKDSYYQLIKKFHPDANTNFPEDIRGKAEQIFTKVTKAYEILLDEQKRTEYDGRDELNQIKDKANSIYEAELIYTEGEMLLRQRNYKEAEKKLFTAIEMNPDESAYIGMYAWARYLAAPDKDRVMDDVKKELNKAIEMDPSVEQNYYYLGSVYKFSENFTRAERNFSKAVEIDPNYIEAKRELRLIKNRKNQKGKIKESDKKIEKKFWSGLFKK